MIDHSSESELDEKAKRLFKLKGYMREAWKLAQVKHLEEEEQEDEYREESLSKFSKSAQRRIEKISDALLSSKNFDPAQLLPFNTDWATADIKKFLLDNSGLEEILFDEKMLSALEKNLKMAGRLNLIVDVLSAIADTCQAVAYKYPIAPVDAILATIVPACIAARNLALRYALKQDPNFQSSFKGPAQGTKTYAVYTGLLGVTTLAGIAVGILSTGPLAVTVAPFLIAVGSVFFAMSNLVRLKSSVDELIDEIKNAKTPKETYRLRILNKGLDCMRTAVGSAFYLSVAILAVATVVALFTNPVGLAVLAGGIATFAIVTAAVSLATIVLKRTVEAQIQKKQAPDLKTDKITEHSSELKNKAKGVLEHLKKLGVSRELENHVSPLIHEVEQKTRQIHAHSKIISHQAYQELALASIKALEHNQKTNPLYEGVQYAVEKSSKTGREILSVSVPSASRKSEDAIKRYHNDKHQVEITLNRDPSDTAIFILFDLNKAFLPLEMDACGQVSTALRIFEAAKLANVDVKLHPKDLALLNTATDPKLKAYFKAIEHWSPEEFQAYAEKQKKAGDWKLGTIPVTVPDRPVPMPRPVI